MSTRRSVIDHVDLLVSDLEASARFYTAALQPLGYNVVLRSDTSYAFGTAGADNFGINRFGPSDSPTAQAHVAFVAHDRSAIDAFFAAAIANGGVARHPPAIHAQYHAGYYAAFVYDPDDNNIEAVFHDASDSHRSSLSDD